MQLQVNVDFNGDLDVDGTTNLDVVDIDGAVDMASTLAVGGVVTANAGVVVDNITIDGNEIDLSSGDLTIDVAGDIIFDADGDDFIFAAAGTNIGKITNSSSDFLIRSLVQDKDIIFKGADGGSTITALTLDMSDAGAATFNSTINGAGILSNATNFGEGLLISQDAGTGTLSSANRNTGFGYEVFDDLTGGDDNSAFGQQALAKLTTGGNNTAVGSNALETNTTGAENVAVGSRALEANTTANENTGIGMKAF